MKTFTILLVFATSLLNANIIVKDSQCSFNETVKNVKQIVKTNGLDIFAIINHEGNAKMVNMTMPPSKMIIFGNPKLGTILMQQDIRAGLDLPLRILVYKDEKNQTKMAYRDGSWLEGKYTLNAPDKIQKINQVMDNITTKAGQCKKD